MQKISMAAARKNAKLSQSELAKMMEVSRETIYQWESGKRKMKTAYLYLFCTIVGFRPDEIFLPEESTKRKQVSE